MISTCHWGNLLVWENGRIRLEFKRKDGTSCHDGPINQIVADEGELITIGSTMKKIRCLTKLFVYFVATIARLKGIIVFTSRM